MDTKPHDGWVYRARVSDIRLVSGRAVALRILGPDEREDPCARHVTITVDAPLFGEDVS